MQSKTTKTTADVEGIEDSTDLLLTLLYSPGDSSEFGEPIEGRTRMQKLMFLLQQDGEHSELVEEARGLDYDAYKMGPYSKDLTKNLEELESANIVKSERLKYWIRDDADPGTQEVDVESSGGKEEVESEKYMLTDIGKKIAKDIWEKLGDDERQSMEEFKSFFNSLSLRQLLIYTYERFPEYTTESEIKDELGL